MVEEIEFLTGPDLIQQGQLEVILSLKSILFFSTIDQYLVEQARKPRSYASLKLRLTDWLTHWLTDEGKV